MTDESVFAAALAIASPSERAAYLDGACAGNPALRREVEELLSAHAAGSPLDRPPRDVARTGAYEPRPDESGPSAAVGDRIGPYKLLERIGRGGMGEVWVADQQEPIKRRVALKLIKPGMDSRGVLARFEAERQALAVMDHPSIARVLDAGTTPDGRPYFAMELVKGTPITEFCDARKLTPRERLELFVPVCQAIQHAHQKGIIHRDIKPGNVLVALHDETPVPKVIDFGVAKAVGQQLTEKTIYTSLGAIVGTPAYMAPEQASFNQLDVDTRADVYALGVLLYELLAGSPPIEADRLKRAALDEVLRIVRDEEPPRPSQRLSTSQARATIAATRQSDPTKLSQLIRGELDWIVMKALEKDRTRRYDTATALAKDVQRHLTGEAVEACPPTLGYRLRKAYRKNRAAVRVAGAFAGLMAGAVIGGAVLAVQAMRAEKLATENAGAARVAEQLATENANSAHRAEADAVRERDKVARANAHLRLTQYIAEMNLLQAAHQAGDLARVKQILDRQRPGPGEPDLRGPEWHYWNRTFHSHDLERRIPCPPRRVKALDGGSFHGVGLAPDGNTVVVTVCGKTDGLSVQLWDLARAVKRTEFEVVPDTGAPVRTYSHPIRFSPDGRKVAIERRVSTREGLWVSGRYASRMYLVDLTTGAHAAVDEADTTGGFDATQVSEDLTVAVLRELDPQRRETTLVVRRVEDRKEIGRLTVAGLASASVTGDGHVLIRSALDHRAFGFTGLLPRKRAVALSCWKLGADKPVWHQNLVEHVDSAFRLTPDGRAFNRLVSEEGYWRLKTCATATGRTLSDQQVVRVGEAGKYETAEDVVPAWTLSADGRRIAYQTRTGLAVRDLGVTVPDIRTLRPTQPIGYAFESFEEFPEEFAFLPDGRLGAAWSAMDLWMGPNGFQNRNLLQFEDAVLDEVVVRLWSVPPFGAAADRATAAVATSSDRRLFALLPRRRIARAGAADAVVDRLCVLAADGRCAFATDLRARPADTATFASYTPVGFSPDDRHLFVAGQNAPRWDDAPKAADPFVVWELPDGREVARVAPDPGTTFYGNWAPRALVAGSRVLLQSVRIDALAVKDFNGSYVPPVCGGRVVAFPSGKTLFDIAIPAGVKVGSLAFDAGMIVGYLPQLKFRSPGETIAVHEWDGATGAYRGPAERKWPFRGEPQTPGALPPPAVRPAEWLERGTRAVRLTREAGRTTAEVWDVARRGPTDRPLFQLTGNGVCDLNADGSRLLVSEFRGSRSRAVLYCTTTGREVLSLRWPDSAEWVNVRFGRWSPDGGQFWFGVDADGKPVGWDFRPLPEPQK